MNIDTTVLIFEPLTLGDIVVFPHSAKVGVGVFSLSVPIFDNDFMPNNQWVILTALPDHNINVQPFVYIQMGALAAT